LEAFCLPGSGIRNLRAMASMDSAIPGSEHAGHSGIRALSHSGIQAVIQDPRTAYFRIRLNGYLFIREDWTAYFVFVEFNTNAGISSADGISITRCQADAWSSLDNFKIRLDSIVAVTLLALSLL
jgi:hypothetical protein